MPKRSPTKPKRYQLSFGAVPIDISKELNIHNTPKNDKEISRIMNKVTEDYYGRILSAFRGSPFIAKIDAPEKLEGCSVMPFGFENKYASMKLVKPIKIECVVPSKLTKTDVDIPADFLAELVPRFNLLYDGINFAFYKPIKKDTGPFRGAVGARELLENIFLRFDLVSVFPTPLRQDFIIDTRSFNKASELDISFVSDYELEIITNEGIEDPDRFIYFLFRQASLMLSEFYSLSNCATGLKRVGWNLIDICQDILTERSKLISLLFYNARKRHLSIENLSRLIHNFYTLYAKWSKELNELKTDKTELASRLKTPLATISRKLLKDLEEEKIPISAYLNIVELAQKDIATYKNFIGLVLTIGISLLSAVIGAMIGALLAR